MVVNVPIDTIKTRKQDVVNITSAIKSDRNKTETLTTVNVYIIICVTIRL